MHSTPGRSTSRRQPRPGALVALALAVVLAACTSSASDGASGTAGTGGGAATVRPDDDLRLNEIQAIGTHNSFHVAAPPEERALLEAMNAEEAAARTYTHAPLATQVGEQRIRQLELDVFADAKGGLYADPVFRSQAGLGPYAEEVPAMAEPGTKVLHEQDVDYHSVCPTFVACLTELERWSDANPDHVPVAVHVQFKDGPLIFDVPGQARPEPWWADTTMEDLDAEIRSVMTADDLVTPDDVRGDHATLEEAVLAGDWPTLGESRGRFLFLMINSEPYRSVYLGLHPNLGGAVLFTNAAPGQPDAAYIGVDDPRDGDRIAELVREGYLVRTRADEPGEEDRTGDTSRRDAALASGAQWISTDYPGPDGAEPRTGTDYLVALPDFRPARCNPVTAPDSCEDARVEP